ncbi:MAG: DUF1700 domain-containing protein [Acidobacteriota bacterium]|jgi:uncharacterized membrane protein|nr:DUF1700 domain-containing protein [Acidobacteriota bacterium]
MSKKEFLEKLAQKLKILNKEEVADIVNEYAGYIDNKIAEGKSEEEAVADFGNINDLVKEILSAYKLSEDYTPPEEFSSSRLFDDTANFLNKSIEFTARFFNDIFKHTNANYIVNILVTIFVALILVAIVKIPFLAIEHLGRSFVHFVFPYFLNTPLAFIWTLLVNIIYLIVVIFIIVSLSKGGFGKNTDFIKNSIKNATERKKEYKEKYGENWHKYYHEQHSSNFAETNASEASMDKDPVLQRSNEDNARRKNSASNPFSVPLKVLIHIFAAILLLPLFSSVIILGVTAGILVYLLTQGISIYGPTLLVIGFFILFASFISLIIGIIYKHGKKLKSHIASLLIASVLIGFGGIFSFFEFMNYDYIDTAPETAGLSAQKNYTYTIDADQIIINANNADFKYVVDNTLENRIVLDVKYNNLYNEIDIHSAVENQSGGNFFNNNRDSTQIITINHYHKIVYRGFFFGEEILKSVIDGLKDRKIYNMKNLFIPHITVYANETFLKNVSESHGGSNGKHRLILGKR